MAQQALDTATTGGYGYIETDARAALRAAGLTAQQTERDIRAAIDGAFTDEGAAA